MGLQCEASAMELPKDLQKLSQVPLLIAGGEGREERIEEAFALEGRAARLLQRAGTAAHDEKVEATLWAAYTKLKERLEAEKRSAAILQEQCLEMRAQQGQALLVRTAHTSQALFRSGSGQSSECGVRGPGRGGGSCRPGAVL